MSHKFLLNASFHYLLVKIDQDMASSCQQSGCMHCGGSLDRSPYPRSPHGAPIEFREYYEERISFTCRKCRKRTTPPTVRFFGRYWYVVPVLILISALSSGINDRRRRSIKKHFGITVNKFTWKRWRAWWRSVFVFTPFWQQLKGTMISIDEATSFLPRDLIFVFTGTFDKKIVQLLKCLSPLTSGNLRAI